MPDYGVNLICVEDGIDSSKDVGNLLIAEDEVEIIRKADFVPRKDRHPD